jgi:hypothetical protein
MSKKCQIPSWKMEVSVNFESPYSKKFEKNLKKEAHRHLELTVLNTFSEKKNTKKSYFWSNPILENGQHRRLPP